jgi:hypothetical protein
VRPDGTAEPGDVVRIDRTKLGGDVRTYICLQTEPNPDGTTAMMLYEDPEETQ